MSARLVILRGEKLLEVKEARMDDFPCPNCQYLITQRNSGIFPNFLLEPKIFHDAHKPVDKD